MDLIEKTVDEQRTFFKSGGTRSSSYRIRQLKKLKSTLKENEAEILKAVERDFSKPHFETFGTELGILYTEIDHILRHLKGWMKPEKVWGSLINFPSRNYIYSQPYGVSLVISAWNYPIQLALNPVLGSIAAGNCTIVKPSELAPNSSALLARIINSNFESHYLHVMEGDAETTQKLLNEPLDYIFFTGSSRIGRIIMKKAAEQLAPVTLELGGKSPAIVDPTASLPIAARRIAWGKFVNAGQTCVAPDYLYAHEKIKDSLVDLITDEINSFYGSDPRESTDYARIINKNHFERLRGYLDNGRIISGGSVNESTNFIEPTILDHITWDDPVMKEEIFGPILPVLTFGSFNEVIEAVNSKPEPLALYLFSNTRETQQRAINEMEFGGGCINDTIAHLGNQNLPFGGVGSSGIGNYHGKASFDRFSHKKSIMKKPNWPDNPLRYPPYKENLKWLKKIFK